MSDIPFTEHKERIVSISRKLRIPDLAKFEGVITPGAPFDKNLHELLSAALSSRMEKSLARRISAANLDPRKNFDTFIATSENLPNVDADFFAKLRDCSFIDEGMDAILLGQVGRGKSHLATAVGIEAVRRGHKVSFVVADRMLTDMDEAKSVKALTELSDKLRKYDLLIIDEVGFSAYNSETANMLFRVVRDRYEKKSTIITTNFEFSRWKEFISDAQLLLAIMDRISHHSIILNMNGAESFRAKEARARVKTVVRPLPAKER